MEDKNTNALYCSHCGALIGEAEDYEEVNGEVAPTVMSAIPQPATDAVRLYGQKTITEMNTPHSVVIATRITTQDAAVVMHCFMRMMHTTSTDMTTAPSAITMKLTRIVLYTTTATSLSLYSTAILSGISALSWRLTVQ